MSTTTIKLDTETRDLLRGLLRNESDTYDALLRRLMRSERRRQMAEELATWVPTDDERRVIEGALAGALHAATSTSTAEGIRAAG